MESQQAIQPENIDAALAVAHAAEGANGGGDLRHLAQALSEAAEAQPPAQRDLLRLDARLCSLWLAEPGKEPVVGLYPLEGFEPGSFPDEVKPYFEQRAAGTGNAVARARYHEALWTRWHEIGHAWAAQAEYLAVAQATDLNSDELGEAFHMPPRAAELALRLDHDREATGAVLRSEIRRCLGHEAFGYLCRTAEHGAQLIALDEADARALLAEIEADAANSREAGGYWREQSLLGACVGIAVALGDKALSRSYRIRIAQSLEAQGRAQDNALGCLSLLSEAAQMYQELGMGADAQRLKPELIETSRRTQAEMVRIGAETEIPSAVFEDSSKRLRAWSREGPGPILSLPFELGVWRPVSQLAEGHETAQRQSPLLSLFGRTLIEHDGRYQPEPDDNEDARFASYVCQQVLSASSLAHPYLRCLREHGSWTVDRVASSLVIVDGVLAQAIRPGLAAFELGDYWTALHIFLPQLERLVREVGSFVGAKVASYAPDAGLRWADMSDVLEQDVVQEAITPDLCFALDAVFLNRFGANLRNNWAHGALEQEQVGNSQATAALFAIFAVGLYWLVTRGQARFEGEPSP